MRFDIVARWRAGRERCALQAAASQDQEPPEVATPEPELAAGAEVPLSPLELAELLEELLLEEELLEEELLEDDEVPLEPDECCAAAVACVEPGRATATPAAASTLAAPAAAVTVRNLDWFLALAASAASRDRPLALLLIVSLSVHWARPPLGRHRSAWPRIFCRSSAPAGSAR
jgi:hypothetical protein